LVALLMPAMSLGEELVIEAPVSRRLLRSARTVMDIYSAWWDHLHPVRIRAGAGCQTNIVCQNGVELFFTTGVDCFYSLRRVAEGVGRRSLVVDTNVRSFTTMYWEDYHGAALGSVALALQGLLGRCLIAASDYYRRDLPPWGSHSVLDHLWSTEGLEIVHDGAEGTRMDKVERRLAGSSVALENLSVCWRSKPAHNCGVCEKCLRTMIAFELAGALGKCETLPRTIDLDDVRRVQMNSEASRNQMRSMAAARSRNRHDLADAAEQALRRYPSSASAVP
jgi:hypothetical protein